MYSIKRSVLNKVMSADQIKKLEEANEIIKKSIYNYPSSVKEAEASVNDMFADIPFVSKEEKARLFDVYEAALKDKLEETKKLRKLAMSIKPIKKISVETFNKIRWSSFNSIEEDQVVDSPITSDTPQPAVTVDREAEDHLDNK